MSDKRLQFDEKFEQVNLLKEYSIRAFDHFFFLPLVADGEDGEDVGSSSLFALEVSFRRFCHLTGCLRYMGQGGSVNCSKKKML